MSALLIALLAAPALAALVLWALPAGTGDRVAAIVGSVVSGLVLVGSAVLWWDLLRPHGPVISAPVGDGALPRVLPGAVHPWAETDLSWIPALDVRLHLGIDTISMPLIMLTALLVFLCCLYSLRITPRIGRARSLIALLLVIETGVIGTFSALDLVLFFLFFEVVLIGSAVLWWDLLRPHGPLISTLVGDETLPRVLPGAVHPWAETDLSWIPALDVRFHLGIDTISMPLIMLTALLVFLCCLYSLRITPRIGRTRSLIAL
ncbi:MAG TPA: hypothetical protein VGD34_13230, partial [Kribbella sp.]